MEESEQDERFPEVADDEPKPRPKKVRRSTFLAPRNSAIVAKLERQCTLERQRTLERQDSSLPATVNESSGPRLVRQVTFERLALAAAEARAELRESRSDRVQRANAEQQVSTDTEESTQKRITWDGEDEQQASSAARAQRTSSSSSVQSSAAAADDANDEDAMILTEEELVQEVEAENRHRYVCSLSVIRFGYAAHTFKHLQLICLSDTICDDSKQLHLYATADNCYGKCLCAFS
jgi:hypothetical protein